MMFALGSVGVLVERRVLGTCSFIYLFLAESLILRPALFHQYFSGFNIFG